jgi:DNA-binding MarR family transcriptional regulator
MSRAKQVEKGDSLIGAIYALSQKIMRLYLNAVVRETGLNWQDWRILRAAVELQTCRAQDISSESGLQKTHVSTGLSRLEKLGHIKRVSNPDHARNKLIISTEKGHELVQSASPVLDELESTLAAANDDNEGKALLRSLQEYEEHLGKMFEDPDVASKK